MTEESSQHSLSARLNDWISTHRFLVAGLFIVLYGLGIAGTQHVKFADPDEVVFMWIAKMPGLKQIWDALIAGINIDPPFTQTLVHGLYRLFGPSLVLARLPQIVGFCLVSLAAYALLLRHVPAVFAAAMLFVPLALSIRSQATEARPYALMMGCAMLALLCWDAASRPGRRMLWLVGLACSLAICVSCHFFGTLVLFPLAVGELYKLVVRRSPDWGCWIAIVVGAMPLLAWSPIVRAGAANYGKHYFGRLSADSLYLFYNNFALLAAFALFLLFACVALAFTRQLRFPAALELDESARALLAVVAGFLFIPALGFTYSVLVSHFFVPKYLMLSTFGIILGVPLLASVVSGRSLLVGTLFLAAFGLHGLFILGRGAVGLLREEARVTSIPDVEEVAPRTRGDIVVASAILFEVLVEAGGPGSERLIYLYDPEKSVRYSGSDSSDLVLRALDGKCPARFDNYDHYAGLHRQFYLLTAGPVEGVNEWIMTHLRHLSARFQYVKSVGVYEMYLVTLPEPD